MFQKYPAAKFVGCLALLCIAASQISSAKEGEVIRPLRTYTGLVSVAETNFGPSFPQMQVIRSKAEFEEFRSGIPKTEISKTNPPPANTDQLLKELPTDFSTHFAVVLTDAKVDQATITNVDLTEKKLIISATFPPEISSRPIGTGSYTLLVFPKLKPDVKVELNKEAGEPDRERVAAEARALKGARAKNKKIGPRGLFDAGVEETAKRVALSQHPSPDAWEILIHNNVLRDGMSYPQAVAVLGHAFGMPEPAGVISEKKFRPAWYTQSDERSVMEGTSAIHVQVKEDGTLGRWRVVVLKK